MEDQTTITTKSPSSDSKMFGVSLRGLIALMLTLTVCAMSMGGLEIKEPLYTALGAVLGLYFGQTNKKHTT